MIASAEAMSTTWVVRTTRAPDGASAFFRTGVEAILRADKRNERASCVEFHKLQASLKQVLQILRLFQEDASCAMYKNKLEAAGELTVRRARELVAHLA